MPDSTAAISREQRAAADFSDAMFHIRSRFASREDRLSVDALTEAALRFAACELRMRRSDRLRAVALHEDEAEELAESAITENDLGLTALSGVRSLIDRLSKEETKKDGLSLWRKASPRLRTEWRRHVAEVDLGAAEARQLIEIADHACAAVDTDGLAGLGRHLSAKLEELEAVRRTEGRGTQAASFPYWKIVLAALAWGIGVGITFDMITNGAPWYQPWLVWLVIALITFCISLGC